MRAVHPEKTYLGDGVYARIDENRTIWLTVENGVEALEEIALEPEVLLALVQFATPQDDSAYKAVRAAMIRRAEASS